MTVGWVTLDVGEQVGDLRGLNCSFCPRNVQFHLSLQRDVPALSLQALVFSHDGRARTENGPNRVSGFFISRTQNRSIQYTRT